MVLMFVSFYHFGKSERTERTRSSLHLFSPTQHVPPLYPQARENRARIDFDLIRAWDAMAGTTGAHSHGALFCGVWRRLVED